MIFKKLLCKLFGHRSICLMRYSVTNEYGQHSSTISGWKCERCNHTNTEQWDS